MAKISPADESKIKYFCFTCRGAGYVLNFTDEEFQSFVAYHTNIDIDEKGKYDNYSTSKYKRLKSFIEQESNETVAKVLIALAEHQETLTNTYTFKISSKEIVEIANKLNQNYEVTDNRKKKIEFEQIEKEILDELKKAKFTIWIAVAWFTNPNLFNCLLEKKAQGVNIQIIINDDENNNKSGLDFSYFESYKLSSFGAYGKNIMHNKFCIIDLDIVINGSFNWTKNANYNLENIEITPGRENAVEFSKRFMDLKRIALQRQT